MSNPLILSKGPGPEMKRSFSILCLGIVVALLGYSTLYLSATARSREAAACAAARPELSWLKQEFKLSDAEYQRISDLHAAYLPKCGEICGEIAAKNAELRTILSQTNTVTPDIANKLAEIAQLRAQCQKNMLEHFYAVSRSMPPDQGRRYLDWILAQTVGNCCGSSNSVCPGM
jgi:hypothetical protein